MSCGVIAGRDPAIQANWAGLALMALDAPVKPGHDAGGLFQKNRQTLSFGVDCLNRP